MHCYQAESASQNGNGKSNERKYTILFILLHSHFFASVNCYFHIHCHTFAIQHMAEDDAVRHEKYLELWNCIHRHPTVPALNYTPFMLLLRTDHILYSPFLHHPHAKNEVGNYRFQLSISTDFFAKQFCNIWLQICLFETFWSRSCLTFIDIHRRHVLNIFRVLATNCWTIPFSVPSPIRHALKNPDQNN